MYRFVLSYLIFVEIVVTVMAAPTNKWSSEMYDDSEVILSEDYIEDREILERPSRSFQKKSATSKDNEQAHMPTATFTNVDGGIDYDDGFIDSPQHTPVSWSHGISPLDGYESDPGSPNFSENENTELLRRLREVDMNYFYDDSDSLYSDYYDDE